MLPSFFIIGAARAATTTVWSMLGEHPDVFLPETKEPHYFLGGEWARPGLHWYESLFASAGNTPRVGEASTAYSMFPIYRGVPERVAKLIPDARIIYMIRHPVERMVSQWVQSVTSGREHQALQEALVWRSVYSYSSCYGLQLSRWLACYPKKAILVLRSEDLAGNPGPTIDRILSHLELPTGWRPASTEARRNATESKLRLPPPLRAVSGALRGAGMEDAAWRVSRRTPLKEWTGLMRPYRASELELAPELEADLLECFRSDLQLLRSMVGDDLDLYGLA